MILRVVGLGNPILRDDGVGLQVAQRVAARLDGVRPGVEVVESEVGGFALLELLAGCDAAVLIDAIQREGLRPGEVLRLQPDQIQASARLISVHEIDLPSVLELGRELGVALPEQVVIVAIQAQDLRTFGESLTPAVAAAVPRAADLVLQEVDRLQGVF